MDRGADPGPRSGPSLSPARPAGRFAQRVQRWLRPPRTLRPTRAGWLFFALTLGVGFAAMNTGNNLLYLVLSLLLAFLVLSGVLSESALRGLRVRRTLPREMFAGAVAPVTIEIHNDQRRVPSFAVVVEDLLGPSVERGQVGGRVFAFRVGPRESIARSYGLRPPKRGDIEFAGFRISTRFPFGLFSKAMRVDAPSRGLVYPSVERVSLRRARLRARAGESASGSGAESADVGGLRDWAPGDPFRRVHWRASLRRSALLVRERDREGNAVLEVRLHTRKASAPELFERAVQRAAADAVAHLAAGWRVGLLTDSRRIPPRPGPSQRRRILSFLARVAPDLDARETAREARA